MPKSFSILNPSELDPKQRGRVLGMAIAVATVVFILDLVMPLGVAEAVPYVAVVMITLWSPVSRDTIIAALACTVLTILGFLLSPKGSEVWMAVTNRFLALFVIWATALLALRVKEREESVRAKSQMLTGILNNMPAVAFRMDENGYMTDSAGRGLRRIGLRYQEVAGRTGLEPSAEAKARLREVPPGEPVFYESHGSYDGSPWWFLNCLTSDTIEGKGSIGFGIDITDRKRAERRLSAHHAVANILATCESFTDAAPRILEAIGENLAWELGALWIADQQNNVLRCAGTWHSPSSDLAVFESRSYEITFTRGVGLPGRVWQSGEPAWIPDVTEDPNFPRAPLAAEANLHAAFGFPLTIEGEVAGVMEFFSSQIEEPDEDLLAMFGAIGTFIGQSIERKQAERRLAAHHAVTMILADAASFGEATPRILQAICENLGWQMGAIWKIDSAADVLRCAEVWHTPGTDLKAFESHSREITFKIGVGLPGRVWESGRPAWITDVVTDPNFPRAQLAAKDGLHAGFCFPIPINARVWAVMEFFSRQIQDPDKELLNMFAAIGSQIGQFIEHEGLRVDSGGGKKQPAAP